MSVLSQMTKDTSTLAEAASLEPKLEKDYAALKAAHSNSASSTNTSAGRIGTMVHSAEQINTAATQLKEAAGKKNASPVAKEIYKQLMGHTP